MRTPEIVTDTAKELAMLKARIDSLPASSAVRADAVYEYDEFVDEAASELAMCDCLLSPGLQIDERILSPGNSYFAYKRERIEQGPCTFQRWFHRMDAAALAQVTELVNPTEILVRAVETYKGAWEPVQRVKVTTYWGLPVAHFSRGEQAVLLLYRLGEPSSKVLYGGIDCKLSLRQADDSLWAISDTKAVAYWQDFPAVGKGAETWVQWNVLRDWMAAHMTHRA
jgi:hypothetical protein